MRYGIAGLGFLGGLLLVATLVDDPSDHRLPALELESPREIATSPERSMMPRSPQRPYKPRVREPVHVREATLTLRDLPYAPAAFLTERESLWQSLEDFRAEADLTDEEWRQFLADLRDAAPTDEERSRMRGLELILHTQSALEKRLVRYFDDMRWSAFQQRFRHTGFLPIQIDSLQVL